MIRRIKSWWYSRLRRIDREILWPTIKEQAGNIELARDGFLIHASSDHAYSDMTDTELAEYIDNLV